MAEVGDRRIGRRQRLREFVLEPRDLSPQRRPGRGGVELKRDRRHGTDRILVGVPRNDPTDTGGLFIGRRPGTGPVRYRDQPERAGTRRQRVDGLFAFLVLLVEGLLCLSVWGPQPVA